MARVIHYKVIKRLAPHVNQNVSEYNHLIAGNTPLSNKGFDLVVRKLAEKHNVQCEEIVICNIIITVAHESQPRVPISNALPQALEKIEQFNDKVAGFENTLLWQKKGDAWKNGWEDMKNLARELLGLQD